MALHPASAGLGPPPASPRLGPPQILPRPAPCLRSPRPARHWSLQIPYASRVALKDLAAAAFALVTLSPAGWFAAGPAPAALAAARRTLTRTHGLAHDSGPDLAASGYRPAPPGRAITVGPPCRRVSGCRPLCRSRSQPAVPCSHRVLCSRCPPAAVTNFAPG